MSIWDVKDPQELVGREVRVDVLEMLYHAPAYDDRVTVMISHPAMSEAGLILESTYGCGFKSELQVGDKVLCPPAPRWPLPFEGVVTALTGNGWEGPVKYLIRKVS